MRRDRLLYWFRLFSVLSFAVVLCIVLTGALRAQEEIRLGDRRVVGGEKTDIKEHPWQVAFNIRTRSGTLLCGGSIVAYKWVLTAAHCFGKSSTATDVHTKAGETNYRARGHWVAVDRIVIHEDYDPKTFENDIALVKLNSPPRGKVIPLATADMALAPGQHLEVTGWGDTSEGGRTSDHLLKVTVPYVDRDKCNAPVSYNGGVTGRMLCAGREEGGVDACQGDSGGPLVLRGSDGPVLVGVVSHGKGCARELKYGVYTRVGAYRDWITGVIVSKPN